MSILVFLISCGFGAVAGLIARPSARGGRLISLAALCVAFLAALLIGPNTSLNLGDVTLEGGRYSGFFLACVAGSALLLCVVSLSSGWNDELPPAALASLAGIAVALTSTDPSVSMVAGAALATSGALLMVTGIRRSDGVDGRVAEMRTVALVSAGLLFGGIAILRPTWAANDGPVFVLAFIGLSLALAIRSGVVPFHVPATHLSRTATPLSPALLLVWVPASLGLVIVAWSATTFGIKNDALNSAVTLVQAVAVATLVLGALAALVHDEIEEIATYSIVADAGFVLLALAARSDAAAEPARLWLLVFVAGKTALVAWTAAISHAFGSSNVTQLRGWLRRAPLLGVALVVIAVATIGWPGGGVFAARQSLVRIGLPGQLQFVFAVSILLSVAYYLRLLVFGLMPKSEAVKAGNSERPQLSGRTVEAAAGAAVVAATAAETTAEGSSEASVVAAAPVAGVPVAAAPVAAEPAIEPAVAKDAEAIAADAAPADAPPAPAGPGRLSTIWRMNRTLEMNAVVAAGAILAAILAFGSLGAGNAARSGIPLDTAAHATPARTRSAQQQTTPTPKPTLAPHPTANPSGGSSNPSIGPSSSLAPVKTSDPARDNTD